MISINIVEYNNKDFIQLCSLLEKEHIEVIKEQRSPKGNCLNNLDKFKYVFIAYDNLKPIGCLAMKDVVNGNVELGRLYVLPEKKSKDEWIFLPNELRIKFYEYFPEHGLTMANYSQELSKELQKAKKFPSIDRAYFRHWD